MDNKQFFNTVGYPRSGNTFLNYSFNVLYYPNKNLNKHYFTAKSMDVLDFFFYPYRNPIDSIVSWNLLSANKNLQAHIDYYNRMYTTVLNKFSKAEFMDFNVFTKDISYIKNKVEKRLNIKSSVDTTCNNIKNYMSLIGKQLWIPRNNDFEKQLCKEVLLNDYCLKESEELYQKIKQL
jgi:hypothetical protein